MSIKQADCPVCEEQKAPYDSGQGGRDLYDCPRCGRYSLTSGTDGLLQRVKKNSPPYVASAILSSAVYRLTKRNEWVELTGELIDNILKKNRLPSHQEQLDNFILWLAEKEPLSGGNVTESPDMMAAVGSPVQESIAFISRHAVAERLVEGGYWESSKSGQNFDGWSPMRLTFKGWSYLAELQRRNPASRQAFMAMKFGDEELDTIFKDYLKAAVKATGFDLKRLDEELRAGLIDDRLRVEIRQSKFLIADLTHGNAGAYWEAGFAEGLGKPVIYMCREDIFKDEKKRPHFDTNHHLTVPWNPANIADAVGKLKATIRATLPDEAKMTDEVAS